jgi:23S rRNA-/tRNA-specific pseudouridylate synthase
VLVIAKDVDTFDRLHEQFLHNQVQKTYCAVVVGNIISELDNLLQTGKVKSLGGGRYEINEPIGRSKVDPRRWTAQEDRRNTYRDAVTVFVIKETHEDRAMLSILPQTGRTHQIRVHMRYIGFPILGDDRYGTTAADRMYLHAEAISFTYLGLMVTYTSPCPFSLEL